jgi:hypothetical protein
MDRSGSTGVYELSRTLEYVASGTSYMRLSNPQVSQSPENVAMIRDLFGKFVHNHNSHTFSVLYNAFQEKSFGERFQPYVGAIHNIHADSGGLQIVTLGKKITDELKEQIYYNQAKSADIGMCFDEIPVVLSNGRSDRNDVSARYWDAENHEEMARKTGRNVKRQLEIIVEQNSKCRPFIILQGNCYDTYMSWAEQLLSQVPQELQSRIGGIAMGAAALGTGPLEDVKRAFIASQIPLRNEEGKLHLHILGVGSPRRLLPYLIFCQNGLYDHIEISYDSTTHSRAAETGLYFMNGKTHNFPRAMCDMYQTMYNEIEKVEPVMRTLEEFHKVMGMGSGAFVEQGGTFHTWLRCRYLLILSSMRNFMERIETLMVDPEEIIRFSASLGLEHQFRNLYNIKTLEDFRRWESDQYLGGSMKSMAVKSHAPATLEGLFG